MVVITSEGGELSDRNSADVFGEVQRSGITLDARGATLWRVGDGAIQSARLHSVLAARLPKGVTIGNSILNSPKAVLAMPTPVERIFHAIQGDTSWGGNIASK